MSFFRFLQTLLYCICITGGCVLLALAYVAPDIETYFNNHETLVASEMKIEQLREQDDIYISQILMLERDPGLMRRYHDKTFHVESDEPRYPRPDEATIQMALEALRDVQTGDVVTNKTPPLAWLSAANKQPDRTLLFAAGGALIVTAIIFLSGLGNSRPEKTKTQESAG